MTDQEEALLREQLAKLRSQHRALDNKLTALEAASSHDQFSIIRLKKEKLQLKDQISRLEDRLFPDIIA